MRAPEFWQADCSKLWPALLSPLALLYGASVRWKQAHARPYRAKARVVCVGNLTAGGSGKTPVAIALARALLSRGAKVAFLSRGHGGRLKGPILVDPAAHSAADTGDEPLLLAATAPTVVARDRAAGARLCETLSPDVIVMDDGHQNFQLGKDVSIVVVSGSTGFGNGHVIPAGPLREPIAQGLARADAVILMGRGAPELPPFQGPVLRARGIATATDWLAGQTVFAFAGIADPSRFFELLRMTGAQVAGAQTFADHHPFSALEMSVLRLAAQTLNARLVTTEKDYVRLSPSDREDVTPVPIAAVFNDDAQFSALLDTILRPRDMPAP